MSPQDQSIQNTRLRTAETKRYQKHVPDSIALRLLFVGLGWLFAFLVTMAVLPIFLITPSIPTVALWTLIATLALTLLTWTRIQTIIVLIIILLAGLWFTLFSGVPLFERLDQISQLLATELNLLNAHATAEIGGPPLTADQLSQLQSLHHLMTMAISLLIGSVSYIIVGRMRWPWAMTIVLAATLTAKLVMSRDAHILWLVPAGVITMWIFVWSNRIENQGAKGEVKHFGHLALQTGVPLILALAIAALAVPRLDYWQVYSPTLQSITEDLVALLPQNQQERFEIYNFSIRQAGYYPLGGRLGGPLELTDDPLIEVWGDPGYFLKGTSANIYTGQSWDNTMTNPHYRFGSAFNRDEQELVMPSSPPIVDYLSERDLRNGTDSHRYAIKPIMDNVQVIFSDGVITDIATERSEPNQFYFNQSGLVYAKDIFDGEYPIWSETFGLQPALIPGYYFTHPDEAEQSITPLYLNNAITQMEADGVTPLDRDHAIEHYLQIPDLPEYQEGGIIRNLSENITQGARADYEKILLLFNYLARNSEFTYSTDVVVPPEGAEFVTHFMMTRTGYCVYYATALTMMARSVGIPARYVEGFSVPPELQEELNQAYTDSLESIDVENGSVRDMPNATLNAEHAHAWTEVYLHGIGWVPLDPTPGGAGGQSLPIIYEAEPEPLSPTPTPLPEQTGTPTPTPDPETFTPTPAPTPTPTPEDLESQQTAERNALILRIIGTLFVILLIIAAAYLYYKNRRHRRDTFHTPEALTKLVPDPKDRVLTYWTQITRLLALLPPGAAPSRASLSEKTAWHLAKKPELLKTIREPLVQSTRIAQRTYFSPQSPSNAELETLAETFDALEALTETHLGKPKYLATRLLRPGSFQVETLEALEPSSPPKD